MILNLDMNSETPIYTQICNQIVKAIAMNHLSEGDELPSVRSLASDIGVNLHTVNKAYNALKADGFLIVNRRKGVLVNSKDAYQSTPSYEAFLKTQLEVLVVESLARGLNEAALNKMIKKIVEDTKGGVL